MHNYFNPNVKNVPNIMKNTWADDGTYPDLYKIGIIVNRTNTN